MSEASQRAAVAAVAAQIDRGLEFQPVLDTFSTRMWDRGLREALVASPSGGVAFRQGMFHVNAIRKGPDAFMVYVAAGPTQIAAVGMIEDPSGTLYHFWSKGTVSEIEDVVDALLKRFPLDADRLSEFLSYPEILKGLA